MTGQPVETLLVEDNEDDIVFVQAAFADAQLGTVRDGEEALRICAARGTTALPRYPG